VGTRRKTQKALPLWNYLHPFTDVLPQSESCGGSDPVRADAPRLTQDGNRGRADPVTQTQTRSPGRQSDPAKADPLRALTKIFTSILDFTIDIYV